MNATFFHQRVIGVVLVLGLFVSVASFCDEDAVVGQCTDQCFKNHGAAHCSGTGCVCDSGTCSMDGNKCVPYPTTSLANGNVVRISLADSRTQNKWLSFTATNDEYRQRWYHYMRLYYHKNVAMPLKLKAVDSDPLTFELQNVYGKGYTPFWVGCRGDDGRLRASYTAERDKMPVKFVQVGCNRYKMQDMYPKPVDPKHSGKFIENNRSTWASATADFQHAPDVNVWLDGHDIDECGKSVPAAATLVDSPIVATAPPAPTWAVVGLMGGAMASIVFGGMALRRRWGADSQLDQSLLT